MRRARDYFLPHLEVRGDPRVFRDVQALRAVAVGAVVIYHFWPGRLAGGYVGVDVFFVISGFLITAHLLREAESSGRIALGKFWSRRIRRLLPVALAVLLVIVALTMLVVPASQRTTNLSDVFAAALYAENWKLAADSVDYLSSTNAPTLVQHYWSLSVEEQFYIVWPLLLALALVVRRKVVGGRAASTPARFVGTVLVILGAASLVFGIWSTATNPSWAFFATPTRVWEFAAGALIAAFGWRTAAARLPEPVRAAMSWAGLLAIVAACVLYTEATRFPGVAAFLPVAGATLVIVAGQVEKRYSPTWWGNAGAVQSLGNNSYSIYLWHWPLLLVLPYVAGSSDPFVSRVVLLFVVFGVGALSKRWIEDSTRTARWWSGRSGVTFAAMGAGMAVVLVAAWVPTYLIGQAQKDEQVRAQSAASCLGAAREFAGDLDCDALVAPDDLFPAPSSRLDDTELYECWSEEHSYGPRTCTFGPAEAPVRVALVGDSHAASLVPALAPVVEAEGWRLETYLGIQCQIGQGGCQYEEHFRESLSDGGYDAVIVSGYNHDQPSVDALVDSWRSLLDEGIRVIPIEDVPHITDEWYACLDTGQTPDELAHCVTPLDQALEDPEYSDRYGSAAAELGIPSINLNQWMCGDAGCPAVINNVVVYRDTPVSHLTATFARSLAPAMQQELPPVLEAVLAGPTSG